MYYSKLFHKRVLMWANYACPITIKWYHYAMHTTIVIICYLNVRQRRSWNFFAFKTSVLRSSEAKKSMKGKSVVLSTMNSRQVEWRRRCFVNCKTCRYPTLKTRYLSIISRCVISVLSVNVSSRKRVSG